MTNEEIVHLNREYTFFSWAAQSTVDPIPVARAEGVYMWDADGRRYLDFSSQLMNVNIGHSHPRVVTAIKEQADRLLYAAPAFATQPRGELGRLLAEVTPADLNKTFFTLGGAEAAENAIKIARLFTGRSKIVTRYRAYHGATYGAMSAGGDPRRLPVEPGIPGIVRVFDPHCYRCVFGQEIETCRRECITHIEQVIHFEGPENIAAILVEGVTGTSGIFVPPDDYWPRLREICDRHGILLIADEVMSGFGRTGQWFAVDNWDVAPDMIIMAKGITSGYLPLGTVVVSERITEFFEDHIFWAGLTYSGHPMSCAAGVATIQVYREDGLLENTRQMERVMARGLAELQSRHPSVGDVRGLGLFWVIELVKDRETREPLAPWNAKASELGTMPQVARYLREHGLYTFVKWNWIFVVPPLCINAEQIAEGLDVIDGALAIADASLEG
ncbi:MAG: aminotransferase class III-fold pyridoxal phosphate-dependent enzyme [Anaerolineae bacterium]